MRADAIPEPFARLIEALEPWLKEVVLIGGWAHRLYRLDPRAQGLTYPPLTTLDTDVAVPSMIEAKETSIRDRLLAAGFQEEFVGEDRPPATHYQVRGTSSTQRSTFPVPYRPAFARMLVEGALGANLGAK